MPKASEIVSMIQSITNLTGKDPEVKFFLGDDTTGLSTEVDFLSIYDTDDETIAVDIGDAFDADKEDAKGKLLPYLDGQLVSKKEITPGKCVLTGYFRPISFESDSCPMCGAYWVAEFAFAARTYFDRCLKSGHLDVPVYKSV